MDFDKHAKEIAANAEKFVSFATVLSKVKKGADGMVMIDLSPDECGTLIWGMQILRSDTE